MTRRILIATLVFGVILTGRIATDVQAFEILTKEDFVQKIVRTEHLIKTAHNAIILLDASSSMSEPYLDTNMSRYEIVKKSLRERNSYFPFPELGYNIGLYLYTPWTPIYPVQAYDREKFAEALQKLPDKPRGPTMLQSGLRKLEPILKKVSGRTVVFIFSDGTYSEGIGKSPAAIARELVRKYDVCFCVISTADDATSREVIKKVASATPCSIGIPLRRFVDRPEYNSGMLYVVASTANIVTVTETKVAGVKVDNILFDFDKANIPPKTSTELDVLAGFMQENPDAYVVLAGYTDNTGSEDYNFGLSRRRAEIVADYLMDNFNISPDRIVPLWFGGLNPVGDNKTKEGRRLNRRVEIAVGL